MIKAETTNPPDKSHVSCIMMLEGAPNELGMEMHAIIKAFVLNLLQNSIPCRELNMTMFLAKRFAEAVHEAYQEYMQVKKHEKSD